MTLKDPWARNEAWRNNYSVAKNLRLSLPGFGLALSAFMIYVAIDNVDKKRQLLHHQKQDHHNKEEPAHH